MDVDDARVAFNEWVHDTGAEAIAFMAERAKCGQSMVELHFEAAFLAGAKAGIEADIRDKQQLVERWQL